MRLTTLVLGLAVLGAFVPAAPATHTEPFTATGSFLVGSPVAYLALDACGSGIEDVDSSCFDVPATLADHEYGLTGTDALGEAVLAACFYTESYGFLACDTGTVPAGAAHVSVSALGGAQIDWTFTVA